MKLRVEDFYKKACWGDRKWTEAPEIPESRELRFRDKVARFLYDLIINPDLPKLMFGKRGKLMRTFGVLGTLALIGSVALGYMYMYMEDKELVILRTDPGLKPAIGEPGELKGLEVNNQAGIGWGVYPRGVNWESQALVAGTECLVVPGEELPPPRGVEWEVARKAPDKYYQAEAEDITVTTGLQGLLKVISVDYQELPPGQTCE